MGTLKDWLPPKRLTTAVIALAGILSFAFAVAGMIAQYRSSAWGEWTGIVVIHTFYSSIVAFLIYLYYTKPSGTSFSLPQVKSFIDEDIIICSLEEWLSIGVAVAVYIREEDFERFISQGFVLNIQTNKLVQIRIPKPEGFRNTASDAFVRLKSASRENIILKPGPHRGVSDL